MKEIFAIFISVFIAELGDKTQLAAFSFSADGRVDRWSIFFASSAALVLSTAIAVFFGGKLTEFVNPEYIKTGAGIIFIIMGMLILFGK